MTLGARVAPADVPASDATPWIAMDRGPYFSASVETSLPERGMTPKGLLIRVNAQKPAYVLFDTDLLRYSCGWTGGVIDYRNVLMDGSHQTWNKAVGDEVFGNGMSPGWAKDGSFEDPRERFPSVDYLPQPPTWQNRAYGPLPHDWARYKGLYLHGERVVLSYTVSGVGVLDSPGWESSGSVGAFTRTLNVEPHERELVLEVIEHPLTGGGVADGPRVIRDGGPADHTLLIVGDLQAGPAAADVKPAANVAGRICSWSLDPNSPSGGASDARYAVEFHGGARAPAEKDAPPGGAIAFKRGEYGLVKDSRTIDLSADFSITAWVKTAANGTIVSKAAPGKWTPGGKSLFVRNGLPTFDVGWVGAVAGSRPVNDDRWHHVAVSYRREGGAAQMYVDGLPDGQATLRSRPDPAQSQLRFGITSDDFPGGSANRMAGRIGTIEVYARVLDASEVAAMAGSAKRRVLPLAVAVVGADNAMRWDLTHGLHRRLRLPASKAPTKIKLLIAPLKAAQDAAAMGEMAQASPPAEDLSQLIHGGASHWTQRPVTHGVLSAAAKPYVIDTLPLPNDNPWNARMRLGGFDFFKDGRRAAVCTWDGDVWIVSGIDAKLESLTWQRIATGMFQPLGLKIVPDAQGREQIFVCCRDQITRLHDFNGDGEADFYECFNNDHQVTEHFHEFAMDLQTDAEGNFYYAKGGRHALPSVVRQHGTIIQVSKDGGTSKIIATGFRAPNGVGIGPSGEVVTSDQEGHWTPANRIDLIKPGGFYGYMGSYEGAQRKPEQGYDPPLCWLPVKLDRSPAEELWVTSDKWGPLKGRMIHTSYGTGQLFLVMYETVNGVPQGGVVPFPDLSFNTGTMRGRFHPDDGQLYLCGLVGWASNLSVPGGFFRVRYTGRKLYLPTDLRVKPDSIELSFTEPLDKSSAQDVQNYAIQQWQYRWLARYGSPHYRISDPAREGQDEVKLAGATLSADGKTVTLNIPGLKPVMQMQIELNLDAADGTPIHALVHNTINVVPK